MAAIKLTEAKIRSFPFGSGIHRDADARGLMVICHKATKTYACQGDVRRNGRHIRTVRVKIDRVDRIGLAEARRKARVLMSTIQSGIDPTDGPDESGITLTGAMNAHIAERELRPRTEEDYLYQLQKYLGRFRKRAVADISRNDCRELFEHLKTHSGQTTAASVLRTLRAIINTAMRLDETITRNPVDAVRIPANKLRKVEELDIADFWIKTEMQTPLMRDLQRALLLTGARRTSMLTVQKEHVDLDRATLRFTHMKTGGDLLFPMGPWLTEMLRMRMAEDELLNSKWLWPSPTSKSGHVMEPKRKELPSAHVLRHHARTLMIAAGIPYAESALLLGQKLPGASGGYVHQSHLTEALRPHVEAYEKLVLKHK